MAKRKSRCGNWWESLLNWWYPKGNQNLEGIMLIEGREDATLRSTGPEVG